ncbi:MAG TPA: hypothetical protein VIX80_08725, partial [Candidatus Kapabacteria bacterium]
YLSSPVWHWLPLMKLMQFTWRWDVIMVLGGAVCIALSDPIKSRLLVVVTIAITMSVFFSYSTLTRNANSYKVASFGRVDAHEYVPSTVNRDFKSQIELLKQASRGRYVMADDSLYSQSITVVEDKPYYKKIHFIQNKLPVRVTINTLIFPTWKFRDMNNKIVPIYSDSIGRITTTIYPHTNSDYTLTLEEHSSERSGGVLSLVGIGLLAAVCLLTVFLRNQEVS